MTEKALTVITDALQLIVVQASEAPIEADESQTAMRFLNRMMAMYSAEGIDLGYTIIDSLDDGITVPDGAISGIISNLAVELFPQYNIGEVPLTLAAAARNGKDAMRNLAVFIGASEFPSTLPRGSGNEQTGFRDDHFYPDIQGTVLAETPGSIGLEDGTNEDVNG